MRTVTIPSNMNPWVCNINGVVYSYEAGTEQSVPDEVASLIDNINADQPVSGHPGNDGDVLTMTESGEPVWAAGGKEIENAKETGGFGWTDIEKETIIPETTVESLTKIEYSGRSFSELLSSGDDTKIKAVHNGVLYESCGIDDNYDAEEYNLLVLPDGDYSRSFVIATQVYGDNGNVWVVAGTTEVFIEAETVHTINPMYLGGGGGEVVTVTIDYDSGTATFDKTYEEILSLDNPRFVSNFGVPFTAMFVTEEEIDLYALGFNNVGNPQQQATMAVESIIAYPDGNVFYGAGEYSLTSL